MMSPRRLLRSLFMVAEGIFNRAFGDKLNPYYHLGALTFFLFWIVAATGLYLYAFFDTSVDGAFRSVEALTHGQRYAGGIVRSMHRYASDAMVVTMLIHMARYWAYDRMRGFRWFSWVTGVVLIWLVFAAGANGYMLPWDRLAQFVTQASFEWFDWLPGFDGRLIRNFITDASVSNRLFSLLVFIHIGVPLATLLLMWIHVQRVPKATTVPPRPIAIATVLMLLLLALVVPVHSQGPAQLAVSPTDISLDWFLLALYPLVYFWPIGALWAVVLGGSALLAAAPWLPPKRKQGSDKRVTYHPGPHTQSARPGETLLEAGLRGGLVLPYDCRSGGCGVCVCTILDGKVDHGPYQPAVLTQAMLARGQALMCCAIPLEDVELDVEHVTSLLDASNRAQRFEGRVERIERLAPEVIRLWVALPADQRIEFQAGQYINILPGEGEAGRSFSFANPPFDNERIELHVRRQPGGLWTSHVFGEMKPGDVIAFEGPIGNFTLRDSDRPILFVAGATGFAPIKSIVEDAFKRGIGRPMWLYWGVREQDDLYMADLAEQWASEHANFHFVPVLSEALDDEGWTGRRGLVHQTMLEDHPDLSGFEVYACGSTRMVEAAVPDFLAHGLGEQYCFSDAFVPSAPRKRVPAEA